MYAPAMFNKTAQFSSLYNDAQSKAILNKLRAFLQRRSNCLINLAELTKGSRVINQHYKGTQTVLIDQIKGTESRNKDFDSEFNPIRKNNKDRWISIIAARLQDVGLPAIDLLQVGDTYFVRDGHHRVSVAKALGANYIDANVTVLKFSK
jgi:hypothetical protein